MRRGVHLFQSQKYQSSKKEAIQCSLKLFLAKSHVLVGYVMNKSVGLYEDYEKIGRQVKRHTEVLFQLWLEVLGRAAVEILLTLPSQ